MQYKFFGPPFATKGDHFQPKCSTTKPPKIAIGQVGRLIVSLGLESNWLGSTIWKSRLHDRPLKRRYLDNHLGRIARIGSDDDGSVSSRDVASAAAADHLLDELFGVVGVDHDAEKAPRKLLKQGLKIFATQYSLRQSQLVKNAELGIRTQVP